MSMNEFARFMDIIFCAQKHQGVAGFNLQVCGWTVNDSFLTNNSHNAALCDSSEVKLSQAFSDTR